MNSKFGIIAFVVFAGLATLAPAQALQVEGTSRTLELRGLGPNETFGRPLHCADLDGDGFEDIIVGADKNSFLGGARPTLYIFRGSEAYRLGGVIDLASQSPNAVILGDTGSTNLATALASGDVNQDGNVDLVMTDPSMSPQGRQLAGAAYVVAGALNFFDKPVYDLAAGDWLWKIEGAEAGDDLGGSNLFGGLQSQAAACGNFNGDAADDIAIGAHLATAAGRSIAGKVWVIYGTNFRPAGSVIDLATYTGPTILGPQAENELGTAIAFGNINGDQFDDLILGQEYWSATTFSSDGMTHVILGSSTPANSINLATTNANLRIRGAAAGDGLGEAVAAADINGDGKDDMIMTAGNWVPPGQTREAGAAYAILGTENPSGIITLSSATPAVFVKGANIDNNIGRALAAGDFNGDDKGDFFVAARDGERPGFSGEGRSYVFFGGVGLQAVYELAQDEADVIINGGMNNFQLGDTITAGDIDGDGADELVIAAPFFDKGTGRVLIFDLTPTALDGALWLAK